MWSEALTPICYILFNQSCIPFHCTINGYCKGGKNPNWPNWKLQIPLALIIKCKAAKNKGGIKYTQNADTCCLPQKKMLLGKLPGRGKWENWRRATVAKLDLAWRPRRKGNIYIWIICIWENKNISTVRDVLYTQHMPQNQKTPKCPQNVAENM